MKWCSQMVQSPKQSSKVMSKSSLAEIESEIRQKNIIIDKMHSRHDKFYSYKCLHSCLVLKYRHCFRIIRLCLPTDLLVMEKLP